MLVYNIGEIRSQNSDYRRGIASSAVVNNSSERSDIIFSWLLAPGFFTPYQNRHQRSLLPPFMVPVTVIGCSVAPLSTRSGLSVVIR